MAGVTNAVNIAGMNTVNMAGVTNAVNMACVNTGEYGWREHREHSLPGSFCSQLSSVSHCLLVIIIQSGFTEFRRSDIY